jgi:hypothetical protein
MSPRRPREGIGGGPGGGPNAMALTPEPGPSRTHGTSARGARRSLGRVLDDQDRRLVLVRDDDRDDAQHPAAPERDRVADAPVGTAVLSVGGSAGVPSSRSSLKAKAPIRSPFRVSAGTERPS